MLRKGVGYAAILGIAITVLSACQTMVHRSPASVPPYRESGGTGGNGGGGGGGY